MANRPSNELTDKLPPQNVEAEQCLLGSMMIGKDAILKVVDFLETRDFYKRTHQQIYQAIVELFEKREPIDLLSLSNRLKERDQLNEIGGQGYLTELVNTVPTASNIMHYAKIVQRKRILRDLISASQDIGGMGYKEAEDVDELLDQAEKRIFSIAQKSLSQNFVPVKDALEEAFERIDRLSKEGGSPRGVPTGFTDLDNILSGLQKSDLVILASRPSMGKCLAKDAEIINPNDGTVSTIEELVKNKKGDVLTLADNLKIKKTKVNKFINNGEKDVLAVKTALGKEIKATITHPFLTINGWKPLAELKIGERIATPRKIPVFGKANLPPYQIKSLAYFIAEGGLTSNNPRFTNSNKIIVRDFIQSILKFPDVKISKEGYRDKKAFTYRVSGIRRNYTREIEKLSKEFKGLAQKRRVTQLKIAKGANLCLATVSAFLNGHYLPSEENFVKILNVLQPPQRIANELLIEYRDIAQKNKVTEWLKSLELMGKLTKDKFLPKAVFVLNKKSLSLFFNRLFACDGSFWHDKKNNYHISYSSSSQKLIKQVQHLLLRFGIVSKIRTKKIKYKNSLKTAYELEIHNADNLLAFIKEIGIYGQEEKLKKAKEKLSNVGVGWSQDTLPIEVWEKIRAIKGEKSWYSLYPQLGLPRNHNIHAFRRHPRRETIAKLAELFDSSDLENLARSDIYWDRITSIEHKGREQVYDLNVPETHNFISNDFIVHNSSLALDIARHVAVYEKSTVGIFSLEMSNDQVVDRLIASQANVDLWRLRTGRLSAEGENSDFIRIRRALDVLSGAPIFIDDAAISNILQMRAMARRLQADKGLGLLIIDYLQLIDPRNPAINIVQQITEISRSLKGLARELNVPVLALSQLSRAVEQRVPQIPRLADLRESGALEQDADVVMFIYREDRYNPDTEKKNIADIIIAKHRNGPIGKVELYFDEQRVSFKNLEKRQTQ